MVWEAALAMPQPRPHLCYEKGRVAPVLMVHLVPIHKTDPRHQSLVPSIADEDDRTPQQQLLLIADPQHFSVDIQFFQ